MEKILTEPRIWIEFFEDEYVKLYDLLDDPDENLDLALDYPGIVSELQGLLKNRGEATNAKITEPKPDCQNAGNKKK